LFGNDRVSCDTSALVCDTDSVFVRLYLFKYARVVIILNAEGKPRVKKHLHTAGRDVERWHEKRPPAGDARSGQVNLKAFAIAITLVL